MTLRSTLYPNTGFKLNPDTIDFEKTQIGAATVSPVTIKRESCEFVIDVKDLHGGQIPSKSKDLDPNLSSQVSRAALFATTNKAGIGQGDKTVGILSPLGQMGGEGTPVKGKPLPGDNMENPQLALNNNNQKDAGVDESAKGVSPGGVSASIELNSDGKWRNIRKSPANPHTQANCLRQILLLQLDLIEQQQQQLQSKDKEIDELKADKDSLIARIERMERRLQLTKKDPRDKRLFQPLQPWTPDKDDPWDMDDLEGPQTNPPTRPLPFNRAGKGQKRKFCLSDPKTQKSRGKGPKFNSQKPECGAAPPYQRELRSKETPEKSLGRSGAEKDPSLTCKEEDSEFSAQMEELPFMSTTEMYLCRWHQLPPSPLSEASPKKEEDVAIPSWRENCMDPLGDEALGDISEMLDDAIYLKRHLKLELDEKRRKRWDIQRIREQRMFQRLQQRMNKRKSVQETEPEVSSFYPDSEDVESIVITPFLPVVAFGRPLPKLTPQNFELPWLDDRSRCRIEVSKKHTPHRTCRK